MQNFLHLIFLPALLLVSCKNTPTPSIINSKLFATNKLSPKREKTFLLAIQDKRETYRIFDYLCQELQELEKQISIRIDTSIKYSHLNKNKEKLEIVFNTENALQSSSVIIEELFHVYQLAFYKKHPKWNKIDFSVSGTTNIEYESKFFRAFVLIDSQSPFGETPSQKGLVDFVRDFYEETQDSVYFNSYQEEKYLELLKYFQNHWQKRDSLEKQQNGYSQKLIDSLMPDASFDLINKFYYSQSRQDAKKNKL